MASSTTVPDFGSSGPVTSAYTVENPVEYAETTSAQPGFKEDVTLAFGFHALPETVKTLFDTMVARHLAGNNGVVYQHPSLPKKGKSYLEIPHNISLRQARALENMLPSEDMRFTSPAGSASGMRAAVLRVARHQLRKCVIHSAGTLLEYNGDFYMPVRKGDQKIHVCVPTAETLSSADYEKTVDALTRTVSHQQISPDERMRAAVFIADHRSTEMERDVDKTFVKQINAKRADRCKHDGVAHSDTCRPFSDFNDMRDACSLTGIVCQDPVACTVPADVITFNHLNTDISIYQVAETMMQHGAKTAHGIFLFDPNMLTTSAGVAPTCEFVWEFRKQRGTGRDITVMAYPGDGTAQQEFFTPSYRSLYRDMVFPYGGKFFSRELTHHESGFTTYLMLQHDTYPGRITHTFVVPSMEGKVRVTGMKPIKGKMDLTDPDSYEQHSVICDKSLVDNIYKYASSVDKLTHNDLYSQAAAYNSRFVQDYSRVIVPKSISTEDLLFVEVSILCIVFSERYAADKAVKDIRFAHGLSALSDWVPDFLAIPYTAMVSIIFFLIKIHSVQLDWVNSLRRLLPKIYSSNRFIETKLEEVDPSIKFESTLTHCGVVGMSRPRGHAQMAETFRPSHPGGDGKASKLRLIRAVRKWMLMTSEDERSKFLQEVGISRDVVAKIAARFSEKRPNGPLMFSGDRNTGKNRTLLRRDVTYAPGQTDVSQLVQQGIPMTTADTPVLEPLPELVVPASYVETMTQMDSAVGRGVDTVDTCVVVERGVVQSEIVFNPVMLLDKAVSLVLSDKRSDGVKKIAQWRSAGTLGTKTIVDMRTGLSHTAVKDMVDARRYTLVYPDKVPRVQLGLRKQELADRICNANGAHDVETYQPQRAHVVGGIPLPNVVEPPTVIVDCKTAIEEFYRAVHPQASMVNTSRDVSLAENSSMTFSPDGNWVSISTSKFDEGRHSTDWYMSNLALPASMPYPQSLRSTVAGVSKRMLNVPMVSQPQVFERMAPVAAKRWHTAFGHVQSLKEAQKCRLPEHQILPTCQNVEEWVDKQDIGKVTKLCGINDDQFVLFSQNLKKNMLSIKRVPKKAGNGTQTVKLPGIQTISAHPTNIVASASHMFQCVFRRTQALTATNVYIASEKNADDLKDFMVENGFRGHVQGYKLEADMSQYDKSQLEMAMRMEIYWYEHVGLNKEFINCWLVAARQASLTAKVGMRLLIEYQRKSGHSNTTLGNTVLTMLVMAYCYDLGRPWASMFVGDDSTIFLKHMLDLAKCDQSVADVFNLSSISKLTDCTKFCNQWFIDEEDVVAVLPCPVSRVEKLAAPISTIEFDWKTRQRFDPIHAAYVSFSDNMKSYQDMNALRRLAGYLRTWFLKEYKRDIGDQITGLCALATVAADEKKFRSLYTEKTVKNYI